MRKFVSVLLCLLLISGCACAGMCVRLDEGALLLDRNGGEIVSLGTFEDIIAVTDGLYAARLNGSYALMNGAGEPVTGFEYDFFNYMDGVLLAEAQGRCGLLSSDGEVIAPLEYTAILPVGNGEFWAIRGEGDDLESDELFIIDANGDEAATGLFIRRMRDAGDAGLLAVMRSSSGLWGYCDADGEMVIPARYTHAGAFLNGLAAVVENGLYGAIDAAGRSVIAAEYDYLETCAGGFVLAGQNRQGVWVFDLNGNTIARHEGEETAAAPVGGGYAVYDGETITVYDAAGEVLARGGQGASVSEGLDGALILADGAWGENCVGIVGTDARYQNLYPLGRVNGEAVYAYMQANSARYINDLLGEVQVSVDMESARYGVVNAVGEVLIAAEFESLQYLGDDRLLAHVDGYWQVMDTAGNIYWSYGVRQIEEPSA